MGQQAYTTGSGNFTATVTGNHTIILIGGGGGGATKNGTLAAGYAGYILITWEDAVEPDPPEVFQSTPWLKVTS